MAARPERQVFFGTGIGIAFFKWSVDRSGALPSQYCTLARMWFRLGVPAFFALVIVYWLMVFKPAS
jgi:uncharacterized membrane protein